MDFLAKVERQLDLPPAEKVEVMRELRSHFEEIKDELITSGMDESQAEHEAARRLGEPVEIASRMGSVPRSAGWKSAWLAALPLILAVPILVLQTTPLLESPVAKLGRFLLLLFFEALMVAGTIREFRRDRRPVWLATWFAASLMLVGPLARLLGYYLASIPVASYTAAALQTIPFVAALVIGLWVSWSAPRWRMAVILGALCAVATAVASFGVRCPNPSFAVVTLLWAVAFIGSAVIWTVIALRLFAMHRHSNFLQASLFFFTLSTLDLGRYILRAMSMDFQGRLVPVTTVWDLEFVLEHFAFLLLPIAAVLLYARASRWQSKLLMLSAGVLLAGLWPLAFTSLDAQSVIQWTTSTALRLAWVLFVPLLFERMNRGNRPELVR